MRVPRKVNVAWQTFQAWSHRYNIDSQVKANDVMNAYSIDWKNPNHDFTPHKVTTSSGVYAAGATADYTPQGLL